MVPKCFRLSVTPLTVDMRVGGNVTNWLITSVASYYSPTLKFSELFRTTHSLTNAREGRLHG